MELTDHDGGLVDRGQRDALEERLQGRRRRRVIPIAAATDSAPLSNEQQSIYIDSELRDDPATYNRPCVYRLSGDLDRVALARSLQAIVSRHSVLRSTISSQSGQLQESVRDDVVVDLPFHDFTGIAEPLGAAWAEVHRAARRSFDLQNGPLFRFSLLRIGDGEYFLNATFHHIVFDAASEQVFGDELAAQYDAVHAGAAPSLPFLPIQYRDYAVWQHAQERDEPARAAQSIDYWRRALESVPPAALAEDSGTSLNQTAPSHTDFCLDAGLLPRFRQLCRQYSATPFMLLLAVFGVLIDRYAGKKDVVIACPLSRRNRPELERLIGLFIDTKPFVIRVEPAESFLQHLAKVRKTCIEALSHDDVTLQQMTARGALRRANGAISLFGVFFVFESFRSTHVRSAGLEIRAERMNAALPAARCVLEIADKGDQIFGTLHCGHHQFQGSPSDLVVGHFLRLLESAVQDPELTIRDLPMLTGIERRKILVTWNETSASYPRDKCLHQLFEDQADRTPDAIAVVCKDEKLSFLKLNERSDRLADRLRSLGVGADVPVGLHGDRSIGTLVGLLAILKAGGAYVPLPAGGPQSRYAAVAQDSTIRIVVASHEDIAVPESHSYEVVYADDASTDQPAFPEQRRSGDARPESLACILYTSGSTGKPKGVCVEHRGLVNLMTHRLARQFDPSHFQVAALTSPITFDASITQIFSPLLTGGTLVIEPGIEELLASEWFDRLTAFTGAATVITALAERRGLPASVRVVAVGGEPVPARLREMVRGHPTCVRLDVLYGLTECSGYSTTAVLFDRLAACDASDAENSRDLRTIGRPIANTQVYVLDQALQPVPIGVPGELFIGGDGLTRGFLGDPEHTAQRFLANPFIVGRLLYRTGDMVRWRPDGQLEFLGRIDQQVKLRGNRIELGEIESLLSSHPQVSGCAAMLRERQPGGQQLVAYFVPVPGKEPPPPELRRYLRERLPEYMLPSTLVMLPALPLSSNGKVDRQALPDPDATHATPCGEQVPPRDATEEQLAAIWEDLLRIPRVGIHENFFALGGHSLLAVELFARIEKQFQRRLPLASLFRHETVAALAALLAEPERAESPVVVVEVQGGAPGWRPLFVLPNLGGDLLSNRQLVRALGSQIPVLGLQASLTGDGPDSLLNFEATAALYVQALREFQPQGPYSLAGYSYGGSLAYEMACQLVKQGAHVDLLAIIDTRPNLGLADRGRGWRTRTLLARLHNLPFWILDDALAGSPAGLLRSAGRRLHRLARRYYGRLKGQTTIPEIEEVLDVATIPSQGRERMANSFRALQSYEARPYPGRVTLIRARTRPLFCAPDPDLGWGRLAHGGVDLRIVPGYHRDILDRPCVENVAIELNSALDARPIISGGESASVNPTGPEIYLRRVELE